MPSGILIWSPLLLLRRSRPRKQPWFAGLLRVRPSAPTAPTLEDVYVVIPRGCLIVRRSRRLANCIALRPALGRVCSVTVRALKRVQVVAALCLLVAVPGTCFPEGVLMRLPTGGIVILEGGIATSGALLCKLWLCRLLFW